jgi:glyoxylase-like metal-dependent hydrolase (beta-lactamase superfamily II)
VRKQLSTVIRGILSQRIIKLKVGAIILKALQDYNIAQLDYFIASHYDADHIGASSPDAPPSTAQASSSARTASPAH